MVSNALKGNESKSNLLIILSYLIPIIIILFIGFLTYTYVKKQVNYSVKPVNINISHNKDKRYYYQTMFHISYSRLYVFNNKRTSDDLQDVVMTANSGALSSLKGSKYKHAKYWLYKKTHITKHDVYLWKLKADASNSFINKYKRKKKHIKHERIKRYVDGLSLHIFIVMLLVTFLTLNIDVGYKELENPVSLAKEMNKKFSNNVIINVYNQSFFNKLYTIIWAYVLYIDIIVRKYIVYVLPIVIADMSGMLAIKESYYSNSSFVGLLGVSAPFLSIIQCIRICFGCYDINVYTKDILLYLVYIVKRIKYFISIPMRKLYLYLSLNYFVMIIGKHVKIDKLNQDKLKYGYICQFIHIPKKIYNYGHGYKIGDILNINSKSKYKRDWNRTFGIKDVIIIKHVLFKI